MSVVMVLGWLEIALSLSACDSLKEKRSIVKRVIDRVQHRFNVSISEVGDNDVHRRALIGVSAVANDTSFVNSVLDKVIRQVEEDTIGRAEILDTRFEILHV